MGDNKPKVGRKVWNDALDDSEEEIEQLWQQLRDLRGQRTDPELVLERITEIQDYLRNLEQYLNTLRDIGDHHKQQGL